MCVTIGAAELSNTILYSGEIIEDNKIIHVLGYQNNVKNLTSGPNAMILPLPAKSELTERNMLDTSEYKECLKEMAETLQFDGLSLTKSLSMSFSVQIFNKGDYTVVLSKQATAIPEALKLVPEHKRPIISTEFFEAYQEWYPSWPIAVCCFEAKAMEAAPLLWWYEPLDSSKFFLPALDGHGKVPNLKEKVQVDHTIIIGSQAQHAFKVHYYKDVSSLKKYLPAKILGRKMKGRHPNGDFYVKIKDNGSLKIDRLNPMVAN